MQCFQACDESEFAMSSWVLCGKSIVNNSDKNLVDRQESSTFNVPEELLSLESRVATILDKTTWENVFINAHYLTQQNCFQINGFA